MEMRRISPADNFRRYGAAVLAAVVALYLRHLLAPVLGTQNPFYTVWAAVVFSAWYCGLGPAIFATTIDLVGIWYWFLPPSGSFRVLDPRAAMPRTIGFLVFSGFIVALGESHRRSLRKSRKAEAQLRAAHLELERKVEERTSELSQANDNLRELSSQLQQLRDEERRQIARELHDSVGQLLAALSMNMATVQSQAHKLDSAGARAISENAALLKQVSKEIRTISHLLHPPLLDAAGLTSALRWYVDGFAERSKINVNLEIPADFRRLSEAMELTIFRLVQECLTNIHRHSGSDSAKILLRQEGDVLFIEIQDTGKGISLEKQLELSSGRTGVGVRGMRERLRQFGGDLDIQSDGSGTLIKAKLPVPPASIPSRASEKTQ